MPPRVGFRAQRPVEAHLKNHFPDRLQVQIAYKLPQYLSRAPSDVNSAVPVLETVKSIAETALSGPLSVIYPLFAVFHRLWGWKMGPSYIIWIPIRVALITQYAVENFGREVGTAMNCLRAHIFCSSASAWKRNTSKDIYEATRIYTNWNANL